MISIKRKFDNNTINIVLSFFTGKEYIYFDGVLVSESRSFKKNQHKFEISKDDCVDDYKVNLSGNQMTGNITISIAVNDIVKDNFSKNIFQTSIKQKLVFLITAFALPFSWLQFWLSIGFSQNIGMLISLLIPFTIVMFFVKLMIVHNLKKRGYWQ